MSRPKSPEQRIAALIRDHGIDRVQAAIDMAKELTSVPTSIRRKVVKKLSAKANSTFQAADSVDAASATAK